jgi:hypothetical protein
MVPNTGQVSMKSKREIIDEAAHLLTKELTDQGKLIEAGFVMFRHYAMAKDAPPIQVSEMHLAFMAGAEYVFSSLMNILDPGDEPTTADLRRMDQINAEIERWRALLSERIDSVKGHA